MTSLKRTRRAALGPLLLGLAACSMPAPEAAALPADLAGTEWRAETIAGQPVLAGTPATLAFVAADRIAGSGSCNRYGGSLAVAEGRLRIGPLVATRMACAPEIMAQEDRFLATLEAGERLERDGPALLLYSTGATAPSRFAAAKATPAAP